MCVVCACACYLMHMCVCGGQRSTSGILSESPPRYLRQDLSVNLELISRPTWLSLQLQGSPSSLLSAGTIGTLLSMFSILQGCWIQTHVLMLTQEELH